MGGTLITPPTDPVVPVADSAANSTMSQVLGNKTDSHDGDSVMAQLHTLEEHAHSVSKTYPMLKDGVTLTAHADDWALGNAVTIIGTVINLDNAAAADQGGSPNVVRIPATGHGLVATYDYVKIEGTVNYNGTFQVVAISDANHFDIESAFTAETFAGGGAETATEVIPEDFDIHDIAVEAMNTTGKTYQLILFRADTDAMIGSTRAQIGANKADASGTNTQSPLLPAETGVYGKLAIEDGDNTATMQISLRYHTY